MEGRATGVPALSRRHFVAGAAASVAVGGSGLAATVPPVVPINPLVKNRADAQICRHEDGLYFLTGSVPEYDRLVLRRSPTLAGLTDTEERILWRHPETGPLSGYIWAPELHWLDGRWHIYFAASGRGQGAAAFRIRTWVAVCDGPDPMLGQWSILGQFETPWDSFNLDSTIFTHRGVRYFCWAQAEPGIATNSNIYLAPLKTPLTLAAAPARLTVPTLDWEVRGYKVAEGPAPLARNGRLFMTYSASATDARYAMGLLAAPDDADIMRPDVWTKSPLPVFASNAATSVFGPGHNSFTVDEQGRDILVYHGRDYEEIKGNSLHDPNRHTRIQRVYYHPDGTPDFGVPVGNGPLPERFIAHGGGQLRHDGMALRVGSGSLAESQFRSLPARSGQWVSISPILLPGHFLTAADDGSITLTKDDGSAEVARRQSFIRQMQRDGRVRLQPVSAPGRAIVSRDGGVGLASSRSPSAVWSID